MKRFLEESVYSVFERIKKYIPHLFCDMGGSSLVVCTSALFALHKETGYLPTSRRTR